MKTSYRFIFIILIALLGGVFYSCEDDDPDEPDNTPGVKQEKSTKHTILYYLAEDNNFKWEPPYKINALVANWKYEYDANLLVYIDSGSETRLVHIYGDDKGNSYADTIKTYPSENSADPKVFSRVLNEVKSDFPANSYGLVLLSHATGWLPEGTMTNPRSGISPNSIFDDNGNVMEFLDFVDAIPYNLEYIIFDECLMGGVEVAYELKEKVKYIIASPAEVLSPGRTTQFPLYAESLQHLVKSTPDLEAVTREFYEYFNKQSGDMRSATISLIETSKMENLVDVCREILYGIDIENEIDITDIQSYGYGSRLLYFDLGDVVSRFSSGEQYTEFMNALNKCLLYTARTPGYYSAAVGRLTPINTYSGLSVYIPQAKYPYLNEEYKKLDWVKKVLE